MMQLFPPTRTALKATAENLAAVLSKALPSICLISGDEPLLVTEACNAVRARARASGFTERETHFVERGFDWQALRSGSQTLSLFAEKRVLEVRLSSASPGEGGSTVLAELAESPPPDTLILVTCAKLDSKAQSAKWVTAIERHGVFVQVWPVELPRLPAWIKDRMQRAGIEADPAAAALIAERVEGNLLAAHQEIEKLALLHPQGKLSLDDVMSHVADSARFDVLQVGEACMRGQGARALRIVDGLRQEGVDAVLVLWAITKDLQWIARSLYLMRAGQSAESAMAAERVWRPRQAAMKLALARLKPAQVRGLLVDASRTDRAIKGALKRDPWLELHALVGRFAGVKLARVA